MPRSLDDIRAELLGDWTFGSHAGNTTALTMIGPKLLAEFGALIELAVKHDTPGHVVETGVWRGGACIWAAATLEALGSDKLVYVCDSFEGLPPSSHPKETIDFFGAPILAVSLEEVEDNFKRFGLEHRAVFVKGWFKDTMPTLDIPVAVLRLDGDLYESTSDVLKYMYDRVSPGGYVIVDDFALPSCRTAVLEFRSRRHLRGSLKVRLGAWWQKTETPIAT